MANAENLRTPTSEEAKAMQEKSVKKRYENKIRKGIIANAILEVLTEEDLHEIARGIISRAKENSEDLVKMRDTIGEKPTDKVELSVDDESAREIDEYFAERYNTPVGE
jgi:hypothetical protein